MTYIDIFMIIDRPNGRAEASSSGFYIILFVSVELLLTRWHGKSVMTRLSKSLDVERRHSILLLFIEGPLALVFKLV